MLTLVQIFPRAHALINEDVSDKIGYLYHNILRGMGRRDRSYRRGIIGASLSASTKGERSSTD
jgi:hypothetical protein